MGHVLEADLNMIMCDSNPSMDPNIISKMANINRLKDAKDLTEWEKMHIDATNYIANG